MPCPEVLELLVQPDRREMEEPPLVLVDPEVLVERVPREDLELDLSELAEKESPTEPRASEVRPAGEPELVWSYTTTPVMA